MQKYFIQLTMVSVAVLILLAVCEFLKRCHDVQTVSTKQQYLEQLVTLISTHPGSNNQTATQNTISYTDLIESLNNVELGWMEVHVNPTHNSFQLLRDKRKTNWKYDMNKLYNVARQGGGYVRTCSHISRQGYNNGGGIHVYVSAINNMGNFYVAAVSGYRVIPNSSSNTSNALKDNNSMQVLKF